MGIDKESIIEIILKARSDLTREDILRMVEDTMRRIGAGYLTEQGALYIVASDLGVKVDSTIVMNKSMEVGLKDLYSGVRDVNFTARIMKIYPLRRYARGDGSESMLRVITVYDNDKSIRMNLWDDHANIIERLQLRVGDAIKVTRAYTKSLPDGSVSINTSANTGIEVIDSTDIKGLDELALDLDALLLDSKGFSDREVVVNGILASNPVVASYVSRNGSISKVLRFRLQGYNNKVRVVIWDFNPSNIARVIPLNAKITIIGVRVKVNDSNDNAIELHGDAGSLIRLVDVGDDSSNDDVDVMQFSILAVSNDKRYAIVSDDGGNLLLLDIQDYTGSDMPIQEGRVLECIPSKILGYTVYLDDDSYVRVKEEDSMPRIASTKISEVREEDRLYIVEGIVLTEPASSDVRLTGRSARYSEIMIGDDTKEVKVVAWDKQVAMLEDLKVGDRIRMYGVMARRREYNDISADAYELLVNPFTVIKRLG